MTHSQSNSFVIIVDSESISIVPDRLQYGPDEVERVKDGEGHQEEVERIPELLPGQHKAEHEIAWKDTMIEITASLSWAIMVSRFNPAS